MNRALPPGQLFDVRNGEPLDDFPPSEQALHEPNGLLAVGGDLQPQRLLNAYTRGIFPWYSPGQPLLWWSPNPRAVFIPGEVHVSRRMARHIRQRHFEVSFDRAFEAVIAGCAAPRPGASGTWITDAMADAYLKLHQLGYAHSIECWRGERLCGGLYGVAIGRVFFGESMFSRETNASKTALIALSNQLASWSYSLFDCQVENPHLASLGAVAMPRRNFEQQLSLAVAQAPADDAWLGDDITP